MATAISRMTLAELQQEVFQLTECGEIDQLDLVKKELKRRKVLNRQGTCVCSEFKFKRGRLEEYCAYEGVPLLGHHGRTGFGSSGAI